MRIKFFLISISALTLLSCGDAKQTAPKAQPQEYELMTIQKQDVTLDSRYAALIRGKQDIAIIPRVTGHLTAINVTEGSQVKKGDLMFVIDQAPLIAAYESAAATVELSKSNVAAQKLNLEGKQQLFSNGIIADFDLELAENSYQSAKAQLRQAKAALDAAQHNLDYTEIKSPSDGVVGMLPYRVGDLVGPSTVDGLTVVSDNSQMYVYFAMGESQTLDLINDYPSMDSAIKAMPPVELELNNRTVYPVKGKVESVSGVVDDATGSVAFRAVFNNDNGKLLSGGSGSVIMPYSRHNIFLVPQVATYEIQNKTFVYKVIEGKATASVIEIDKVNDGKNFIVLDGLSVGDVIIAKGAGLVREGTEVKVEEHK